MPARLILATPAKINLSLSVGPKRPDGFHEVDSLFHLIDLYDEISFTPAETFKFGSTADLDISDEDNLVVRAVRAMAELHERELPKLELRLDKHIPHGAGLGGGSSNAAATIYALSRFWNLTPNDPKHLALAAELGSDIPLFLAPTTSSIMTGRGEILKESRKPFDDLPLLLIKPREAQSPTGAVYRAFDANPLPTHDIDIWKNNLEQAALAVSPLTAEVLDWLRAQSEVELAQVAGSGSTCWARFATHQDRDLLELRARNHFGESHWICATTTTSMGIREIKSS